MRVKWKHFNEDAYVRALNVSPGVCKGDFTTYYEGEVIDRCFSNFWGYYFVVRVDDIFMKVDIDEVTIIEE